MLARMVGFVLLCAAPFSFGYVAALGLYRGSASIGRHLPSVARLSYGRVERLCAPVGGAVLCLATALGLAPFAMLHLLSPGWPLVAAVTGLAVIVQEARSWRMPHVSHLAALVALFLILPDRWPFCAALLVFLNRLAMDQVADCDRVPGIPAALFAAPLGSTGVILVLRGDAAWMILLAASGALLALHGWHRFPPRMVLGAGGNLILALLNGVACIGLVVQGQAFALVVLWSVPLAGWVFALRRITGTPVSAFEMARQRGEPEAGLVLATASLSMANAVLVGTLADAHFLARGAALAVSLFLAVRFRLFLTRGLATRRSPPNPAGSGGDGGGARQANPRAQQQEDGNR